MLRKNEGTNVSKRNLKRKNVYGPEKGQDPKHVIDLLVHTPVMMFLHHQFIL